MSFDAITLALAKSYTDQHSGGGGSIQSDWNQNDETAPDYVKNRPFYTGDKIEAEWLPETSVLIESGEVLISSTFENEITVGVTYSVTFDGTTTEYIGTKFAQSGQNLVYFGDDFAQVMSGTIKGTVYAAQNGMLIMATTNETLNGTTHTISIREVTEQVIKVPEKYIPPTPEFVVDATNLPTNATGWRELSKALDDAYNSRHDIFLDLSGNGIADLKLTNRDDINYLFLYPGGGGVYGYVLTAYYGGSLEEISLSTKDYVDTTISNLTTDGSAIASKDYVDTAISKALGVIENGTY